MVSTQDMLHRQITAIVGVWLRLKGAEHTFSTSKLFNVPQAPSNIHESRSTFALRQSQGTDTD
jgi:hypothetical protein